MENESLDWIYLTNKKAELQAVSCNVGLPNKTRSSVKDGGFWQIERLLVFQDYCTSWIWLVKCSITDQTALHVWRAFWLLSDWTCVPTRHWRRVCAFRAFEINSNWNTELQSELPLQLFLPTVQKFIPFSEWHGKRHNEEQWSWMAGIRKRQERVYQRRESSRERPTLVYWQTGLPSGWHADASRATSWLVQSGSYARGGVIRRRTPPRCSGDCSAYSWRRYRRKNTSRGEEKNVGRETAVLPLLRAQEKGGGGGQEGEGGECVRGDNAC